MCIYIYILKETRLANETHLKRNIQKTILLPASSPCYKSPPHPATHPSSSSSVLSSTIPSFISIPIHLHQVPPFLLLPFFLLTFSDPTSVLSPSCDPIPPALPITYPRILRLCSPSSRILPHRPSIGASAWGTSPFCSCRLPVLTGKMNRQAETPLNNNESGGLAPIKPNWHRI